MLLDDAAAVDAHDLTGWEGFANEAQGLCVEIRLVVCGHQHSAIDDEEIGVGGWQALALEDDGAWHRQFDQPIGLTLQSAQTAQFLFHQSQFLVLLICWIVAAHI